MKLSRISTINAVPFPPLHMLEDRVLHLFLDNKNFAWMMIVIQQHVKDKDKDKDKDTLFKVAIYLAIWLV